MKVFVIGSFAEHEREGVAAAVSRAGAEVRFIEAKTARSVLEQPDLPVPHVIAVDLLAAGAGRIIPWLRGEARYFAVPVVALVPHARDQAYVEAFSTGADDVIVRADYGALTRRVGSLETFDPTKRDDPSRGRALVAEDDMDRRRLIGRLLRRSGFDVGFAASGTELVSTIGTFDDLRVLIIGEKLPGGSVLSVVHAARSALDRERLPAVVLAGGSPDALIKEAKKAEAVVVGSSAAPIDNLLFLANEATRQDFSELRRSPRLLFSTLCSFRRAGDMSLTHGLVYNVSRDGLYVRSLDPPERGTEIWLELRPPRATDGVHIRAKVMWVLRVGSPALPAPPGFGVRFEVDRSAQHDIDAYVSAYEELVESPRLVG